MNRSFWLACLSLCMVLSAQPARAASALLSALTDGQHILMIRHADAPGVSDPPHMRLGDCSTQRNLGERGRKQAQELGRWLKQQGIDSAEILSSAWCRCVDTANLLGLGPVKVEASLGSFFRNMSDADPQTIALRALLADRLKAPVPRKPLILVTHQVNISAYTGEFVGQGDVMLVRVAPNGQYVSHRAIPVPQLN